MADARTVYKHRQTTVPSGRRKATTAPHGNARCPGNGWNDACSLTPAVRGRLMAMRREGDRSIEMATGSPIMMP